MIREFIIDPETTTVWAVGDGEETRVEYCGPVTLAHFILMKLSNATLAILLADEFCKKVLTGRQQVLDAAGILGWIAERRTAMH